MGTMALRVGISMAIVIAYNVADRLGKIVG